MATGKPARPDTAPAIRRPTTTSSCWPRTTTGYHNLIKLVSIGYLEGFYYRPRIDKELLAKHSRGAHRPLGLPERRDRAARPRGAATRRGAAERRGRSRDLRRGPLLPRAHGPRHRGAAAGQRGPHSRIARPHRAAPGRHQRLPLPAARTTPTPTTCCSASGPARRCRTPERIRFDSRSSTSRSRRGDGRGSSRTSPRRSPTPSAIAELCDFTLQERVDPARLRRAAPASRSRATSRR